RRRLGLGSVRRRRASRLRAHGKPESIMTASVFIDGAVGTTGLEIADRLSGRDEFTLITLPEERRKDDAARAEALNAADFVILCLPDDAARAAVTMIDNPKTRVIDASSAHRVAN